MKIVTAVTELLILVTIAWLVLPKLISGMEFTHILPGVRLTSNLSLKHLVHLAILIFIYCILFVNNGPGLLGTFMIRLSPVVKALALFTLTFAVYLHAASGHSGDTVPAKLLPISIIEEGNLDLDEFRYAIYRGHYYSMTKQNNHFYSTYPLFPGITVVPFYMAVKWMFPDMFSLWRLEYSQRNGDLLNGFVQLMHHFSAAMISALAVVIFWLIAYRLGVPAMISLPVTMAFAFGTPMMSSTAAALWTHGPAILFMLLAVYCSAIRDENEQSVVGLILGGIFVAWAIACRPTGLVAGALLLIYVFMIHRKHGFFFLFSALFFLSAAVCLNVSIYGNIFGGYQGQVSNFTVPTVERFFSLLMSPSRGLVPFVPLIVVLVLYVPRLIKRKIDLFTLAVFAVVGEIGIYSCWSIWWGGNCFGPRLLAECIMWCLLGILAANASFKFLQRVKTRMVWFGGVVLIAYSICLHITGAVNGDNNWDRDYFRERPSVLMQWKNSQIMWTLTDIRYDSDNGWENE